MNDEQRYELQYAQAKSYLKTWSKEALVIHILMSASKARIERWAEGSESPSNASDPEQG